MGYSVSWLAIKGGSPQWALGELGFRATGEREDYAEAGLSAAELPNGWFLIVSNRTEQVAPDSILERLSASGCELVTCFVEEHVMCSFASGWRDGRKCWSVSHESPRGKKHLAVEGDVPPQFGPIRDQWLSRRRDKSPKERVDYIFEIPVGIACSLTGYRHDQDVPELGAGGFQVLARSEPESATPRRNPSFWKRLFGA